MRMQFRNVFSLHSFLVLLFLIGLAFSQGAQSFGATLASGEIVPIIIEGGTGFEMARYADRTICVAFEVDRDTARLLGFTLKARPFLRSMKLSSRLPDPSPYEEGKEPQIEVVLQGPGVARYTQRIGISMMCLTHSGDTLPHILGDTILVHRDTVIAEVPEIAGFDKVEVAYYLNGATGLERKLLATLSLGPEYFTPAGGSFHFKDLAFAQSPGIEGMTYQGSNNQKEGWAEVEGSLLATSGKVYWPEDYGDPDVYKVYGNDTQTAKRINIVIVPDGYIYSQKATMQNHAASLVNYFRTKTPYAEHDPFINYTLVYAYSTESGTDQCDCSIIKDTAMASRFPNAGYPCGDMGNRCLYYGGGCDTDSSSNIAQAELRAPAKDKTIVMVNTARYGGCGGSRAVYAAANSSATEIAVHELAHSLAGLADEYISYTYCGSTASEINTSLNSVNGAWSEWIADIGSPREGGDYYEHCVFRPQDNCNMRSLGTAFCKICDQHYALDIFGHWRVNPTAPIESQDPASPLTTEIGTPVSFSVTTRLAIGNVTNSITWKLQGPGFPTPTVVATGVATYERSFAEAGSYTLSCEVVADTNFIKPAKNGSNVDTASWNITATLAKPKEVSPPGSLQPLIFTNKQTLTWENSSVSGSASFNLYRGNITLLPSDNYGACFKSGITSNSETDPNNPPAGTCWTYLVTGKNSGGEGPMGNDSEGIPRPNSTPCP